MVENTSIIIGKIKRVLKNKLSLKVIKRVLLFRLDNSLKENVNKKINQKRKKFPFGVNLFIYCTNNSAGVEGRLLQQMLESGEIPYQVVDLNRPDKFNSELNHRKMFRINLIVCHAASGTPHRIIHSFKINLNEHYNIGYWAWELADIPDAFCSGLGIFQEIWTMSSFCTNTLEKKITIPVLTVPLCANPDRSIIDNGREYFKIKKDTFLFMFAYDCTSYVSRKNPQATVQAFLRAFSPEDCNVGLVLKLVYPENFKSHIEELLKILSPYKNIYCIEKYLSDIEMKTLVQTADAIVSLHRSEGFGLLPLEAMSLGTPVISTAWSGNMEYMNHMNTALVGYKMIPVAGQYVGSSLGDGFVWAEPDIEEAAAHMRRMVYDELWRKNLIMNGKYTSDECYNVINISKIMRKRFEILGMT